MNVEELWGKGWSLRPEQKPESMEYLGTITRAGVDYKYYRSAEGEILYRAVSRNGCSEPTK